MSFLAPAPNSFPYPGPAASLSFCFPLSMPCLLPCRAVAQARHYPLGWEVQCELPGWPLSQTAAARWCCCVRETWRVALQQWSADMGGRLQATPEPQCLFSTNTRQWPNSWILWEKQDFAHHSAIFQHQYPPSLYPPQKSCLTEVELSTFACFLSAVASSSSELRPRNVSCHPWEM